MSYSKITQCFHITREVELALSKDVILTDAAERYDNMHDTYERVRAYQGETTPTDHGETPREAMHEYLTESLSLANAALAKAEAEIAADNLVPDPLPIGLILEGSGSGS